MMVLCHVLVAKGLIDARLPRRPPLHGGLRVFLPDAHRSVTC